MIKTAEINQRPLGGLACHPAAEILPPGGRLSIWWMGNDRITFQAIWVDRRKSAFCALVHSDWPQVNVKQIASCIATVSISGAVCDFSQ